MMFILKSAEQTPSCTSSVCEKEGEGGREMYLCSVLEGGAKHTLYSCLFECVPMKQEVFTPKREPKEKHSSCETCH